MAWIVTFISIIIVIIVVIKLHKKQNLDTKELYDYQSRLDNIKNEYDKLFDQKTDLEKDILTQRNLIEDYQDKILTVQNKYREELNKKTEDLNVYFEHQKNTRQQQLDEDLSILKKAKEEYYSQQLAAEEKECQSKIDIYNAAAEQVYNEAQQKIQDIEQQTQFLQERFNNLLLPLQQYEKDQQAKLYYTIQIPEEYRNDIDYLLTTVTQKVQHPDIINKLIWSEYIKPYLDDTFKRVGIESKSGIYKITNITSGKSYIGKSTDIKKRISDHMKSSIGIKSIADQAVHHAILEQGIWNWAIECITYCDKDQLSDLEKYYIDFFKTQEFGYNKKEGG